MSKQILVNSSHYETRVATLEDGEIRQLHIEREEDRNVVGNVYKGVVKRVLPGMQAAFLELGLERTAFLYVDDIIDEPLGTDVEFLDSSYDDDDGESTDLDAEEELDDGPELDPIPTTDEDSGPEVSEADAGVLQLPAMKPAAEGTPEAEPVSDEALAEEESAALAEGADEMEEMLGDDELDDSEEDEGDYEEDPTESVTTAPEVAEGRASGETAATAIEGAPETEGLAGTPAAPSAGPQGESQSRYSRYESPREGGGGRDRDRGSRGGRGRDDEGRGSRDEVRGEQPRGEGRGESRGEGRSGARDEGGREPRVERSEARGEGREGGRDRENSDRDNRDRGDRDHRDREPRGDREGRGPRDEGRSDQPRGEGRVPRDEGRGEAREPRGEGGGGRGGQGRPRRGELRLPQRSAGGGGRGGRRGRRGRPQRGRRMRRPRGSANIQDLLKEGQEILVQVAKAPIGTKGARLTTHISLPGRNLVLMPTVKHLGISRRIGTEKERRRLRDIFVKKIRPRGVGFIIRTVAEGKSLRELKADADYLMKLWERIKRDSQRKSAPALIHEDLSLGMRSVRDFFTDDVDSFIIDNPSEHDKVLKFIGQFIPRLKPRVKLFKGPSQLFEHYGIEAEISRALGKKVWLKSGGYLLIDQSEALTAIDVNTGRYVGSRSLEETILKTNLEAVKEVAYQLRIRNVGGIIIIDLIDMESLDNREKVYHALQEALGEDRAKTNILKISELGLVEMTRKRTHEDLVRYLTEACSYCDGRGYHKSRRTICFEIFREIEKEALSTNRQIVVFANPEVVKMLRKEEWKHVERLQKRFTKNIAVKEDAEFHVEQYEVFGK